MSIKQKLISIFSIILFIGIVYCRDIHHCQHNHIQSHHHEIVPVSHTNYYNHPYDPDINSHRRLTESKPRQHYPIRIVIDTEQLKKDLSDKPNVQHVMQEIKQVIGSVIDKLESMIEILAPVKGNLRLHRQCKLVLRDKTDGSNLGCVTYQERNKCFLIEIPSQHLATDNEFDAQTGNWVKQYPGGSGIPNTDLILYVTSQNEETACNKDTDVIAWAGACVRDQFGKPIAGAINICPSMLYELNSKTWTMYENVLLHELLHVLVFSKDNMANFRDKNGKKIALSNTIGKDKNGIQYVISPNVQQATRDHFDCNDIYGAILEPHGGEGTSGNHWMINLHGELMSPIMFNNIAYLTSIDCALLNDSGWYKVDKDKCNQPWRFAYKSGCEFFFNQCTDLKTQLPIYPQYFCNDKYEYGCSWDGLSLSTCTFIDHYEINISTSTDTNINLDICPFEEAHYVSGSSTHICVNTENLNQRCIRTEFENNINVNKSVENKIEISEKQILFGQCYSVECKNYNDTSKQWQSIDIEISENNKINCNRNDELQTKQVLIENRNATITCPIIDIYCINKHPFHCVYGWYNENINKCVCFVGWTGHLCQDRLIKIYDYPPVDEFKAQYIIPGLLPNVIIHCDFDYVTLNGVHIIQSTLINGGFWYKSINSNNDNKYSMIWYDILERIWIIADAKNKNNNQYVSPKAFCKSKESLDVPDVTICNTKWYDRFDNKVNITIEHCKDCEIPNYFEALKHESGLLNDHATITNN